MQSAHRLLAAADHLCQVGTGGACALIIQLLLDVVKAVATGTVRGAWMLVVGYGTDMTLTFSWKAAPLLSNEGKMIVIVCQPLGLLALIFSVSAHSLSSLCPEASCASPTMTHVLLNFLKVAVTMHLP